MPLTIAHPAVVVPLRRVLGRRGVLSALVIGSMVPDFALFLPLGVSRDASHGAGGLLWFCLPVGCITYAIFHLFLKEPLLILMPAVARRLGIAGPALRRLPDASWVVVAGSVVLGALTHLAWDSFTHAGTPAVRALPWLRQELFSVGGIRVQVYGLLQHLSTIAGTACLVAWVVSWWRTHDPAPSSLALPSMRSKVVAVLMLIGIPALGGLLVFVASLSPPLSLRDVRLAVGSGTKASFAGVSVAMLLFAALWRVGWFDSEPDG